MAMGAAFDFLWILASILPAVKTLYENGDDSDGYKQEDANSIFLSDFLIYTLTWATSVLGGLGEAIQWVA
jgi:hypothetical protein